MFIYVAEDFYLILLNINLTMIIDESIIFMQDAHFLKIAFISALFFQPLPQTLLSTILPLYIDCIITIQSSCASHE